MNTRTVDIVINQETGKTSVNIFDDQTTHIYNNITDASYSRIAKFLAKHGKISHEFNYAPEKKIAVVYKVHQ